MNFFRDFRRESELRFSDLPRDGVGVQQVREEACDVAQFVRLEPVDRLKLLLEHQLERVDVLLLQHAEPLKAGTGAVKRGTEAGLVKPGTGAGLMKPRI